MLVKVPIIMHLIINIIKRKIKQLKIRKNIISTFSFFAIKILKEKHFLSSLYMFIIEVWTHYLIIMKNEALMPETIRCVMKNEVQYI